MKKRLFITTGSISLVNALTIAEGVELDTLIILSFSQSEAFKETQLKIASLHKFKEILFFKKEKDVIRNVNFFEYDEIYSVTLSRFYGAFKNVKKLYLFDEGPGYAISDMSEMEGLKRFYATKFLDKFDALILPENTERIFTGKTKFIELSDKILKILNEPSELKTTRNVLFIGHYMYHKLGDDFALDFYKKYIDKFINLGYNVYLKSHPREEDKFLPLLKENYGSSGQFHTIKGSLPIEICNYNFDLVIGSYSGTLVSLPYYRNIPSVNLPLKELYKSNAGLGFKKFFALYEEYTPSFSEMEDYLTESKEVILKKYLEIINKKPDIKNNKPLRKILLYRPNMAKDILFGILASFVFFSEPLKLKIKSIARKDFYNLIEELLENIQKQTNLNKLKNKPNNTGETGRKYFVKDKRCV